MSEPSYKMRQCQFTREGGVTHQYVAWIPAAKAVIGRTVKIKNLGDWVVTGVGAEADSEDVIANSNDYRRHRKATDI